MISIKIVLGHKPQQGELYPIRIRFTKDRKSKYVSLEMLTEKGNFQNEQLKRRAKNSTRRNQLLNLRKLQAQELIDEFNLKGRPYTLHDLVNAFKGNSAASTVTLKDFFLEVIQECKTGNKYSTAKSYADTMRSLFRYFNSSLNFYQLDNALLRKYEAYLRGDNNQNGGIAFKMRMIRRLYNLAIERNIVDKKYYPFDTYKIAKLKSSTAKRALSNDEFKALKEVSLAEHPHLEMAYDLFMFSFYTRGMNFADIMLLKHTNINNGKITYTRKKTGVKLNLKVLPQAQVVLEKYQTDTCYVFPILLRDDYTAAQIENRKKKVLRRYNKDLKDLAKLAGITSENLTSYVARHTYATLLKFSGVSTDVISQSMGHSSVLVTANYLKEFGNEMIDKANDALSDL